MVSERVDVLLHFVRRHHTSPNDCRVGQYCRFDGDEDEITGQPVDGVELCHASIVTASRRESTILSVKRAGSDPTP